MRIWERLWLSKKAKKEKEILAEKIECSVLKLEPAAAKDGQDTQTGQSALVDSPYDELSVKVESTNTIFNQKEDFMTLEQNGTISAGKTVIKPGLEVKCIGQRPDVTRYEDNRDAFFVYDGELCISTDGGVYNVESGDEVDICDDSVIHPVNIKIEYECR